MITLRIDRFQLLISPFIAFVIAIGFLFLLSALHKNKYTRKIAVVFGVLIFSFLCFSALTGINATDSKDFPTDQNRVYFTEPEMNAFDFIPRFIEYNTTISSDKYSSRMFEQPFFSETKALDLPSYYTTGSLETTDVFTFNDGIFILRNRELEEKGLGFSSMSVDYAELFEPTPEILLKFSKMTFASNKIYDNQKVSILSNYL
jgi:phosphate/sulfate permease